MPRNWEVAPSRSAVLNEPEFLNRVDEIIFFHPLQKEHLGKIIEIQVEQLQKHLADRRITLKLTEAAKPA